MHASLGTCLRARVNPYKHGISVNECGSQVWPAVVCVRECEYESACDKSSPARINMAVGIRCSRALHKFKASDAFGKGADKYILCIICHAQV